MTKKNVSGKISVRHHHQSVCSLSIHIMEFTRSLIKKKANFFNIGVIMSFKSEKKSFVYFCLVNNMEVSTLLLLLPMKERKFHSDSDSPSKKHINQMLTVHFVRRFDSISLLNQSIFIEHDVFQFVLHRFCVHRAENQTAKKNARICSPCHLAVVVVDQQTFFS